MMFSYHILKTQLTRRSCSSYNIKKWNRMLSTQVIEKSGVSTNTKKQKYILSIKKQGSCTIYQTKLLDENGEVLIDHESLEAPYVHSSVNKVAFNLDQSFYKKCAVENTSNQTSETQLDPNKLIEILSPIPTSSNKASTQEKTTSEVTQEQTLNWSLCPSYYMSLSKSRLTGLVVLTTMAGCGMAPVPFDLATFALVSIGTGLTSCCANTLNQVFEVPYDSQMNRTKNRLIVKGIITPLHATIFGLVAGSTGIAMLYAGVNELTSLIGLFNIILYAGVYTPLKRLSIANTWVGAIVGALPPIMGWTACMNSVGAEALLLGGILYAWQFPHFNGLSWNLRGDYSKAGYRMMSATNPDLCKRTSLTYSLAMIPICSLCPVAGLTSCGFALDSTPLNIYLVYLAWKFYQQGDSDTSQRLFKYTLLHLPLIMMLLIINKKRKPNPHKISSHV